MGRYRATCEQMYLQKETKVEKKITVMSFQNAHLACINKVS